MPDKPEPIKERPAVVSRFEPVIGYRMWNLDARGDHLFPANGVGPPWEETGYTSAICLYDDYQAMFGNYTLSAGTLKFQTASGTNNWVSTTPGYTVVPWLPEPRHPGGTPPVWDCTCGLYAFPDPTDYHIQTRAYVSTHILIGAIMAWGRVIFHGHEEDIEGFRAEHAQPVAFLVHDEKQDRIATRYGASKVKTAADLRLATNEHGVQARQMLAS